MHARLGLVQGPAARHTEHEGCLIWSRCAGGDSEAAVPPPVDALAGVLKVQLHTLLLPHAHSQLHSLIPLRYRERDSPRWSAFGACILCPDVCIYQILLHTLLVSEIRRMCDARHKPPAANLRNHVWTLNILPGCQLVRCETSTRSAGQRALLVDLGGGCSACYPIQL